MYLVYGILIGIGMGGIFISIVINLPRWFIARRNKMNGIVMAGMGVGTLVGSPIVYRSISTYGWQKSYNIIGIAFLLIVLAGAQFMRQDPSQVGQVSYDKIDIGKPGVQVEGPQLFTERSYPEGLC